MDLLAMFLHEATQLWVNIVLAKRPWAVYQGVQKAAIQAIVLQPAVDWHALRC
jgi:hypothetical protein